MNTNITQLIKNNTVLFDSYRQQHFYYRIAHNEKSFIFPVPIDDVGTATLLATDKAIVFMRWIRKSMEDQTFCEIELA